MIFFVFSILQYTVYVVGTNKLSKRIASFQTNGRVDACYQCPLQMDKENDVSKARVLGTINRA